MSAKQKPNANKFNFYEHDANQRDSTQPSEKPEERLNLDTTTRDAANRALDYIGQAYYLMIEQPTAK